MIATAPIQSGSSSLADHPLCGIAGTNYPLDRSDSMVIDRATPTTTLVVFDDRVSDLETLYQALLPGALGFTVKAEADGIAAITQLLVTTGAKCLAIVAHGEPGVVHLGKNPLNIKQLQSQSQLLSGWGVKEIALYSCEVAQGDIGQDLIYQLSELTGATVAAAVTKIGSTTLGGNWNLTVTTSGIVLPIPFAAEVLPIYQDVLANFPIVYSTGLDDTPGATSKGTSLGDFNNDGNLDLVTRTESGDNVLVALGDGNNGFYTSQNFPSGASPKSVNVGDFNADEKLDIVIGHYVGIGKDNISILFGNGDGTFGSLTNINDIGTYGDSVQVGDFNGDLKPDIAVANLLDRTVSVLLGNGNGTFGSINKINLTTSLSVLRLGDFNNDGKLDVITAGSSNAINALSVSLGNSNGTFQAAITTSTGPGGSPSDMSVSDFNGDGKLDLAIVKVNSNNVSISLGNGNGTFSSPTDFVVGRSSRSIAVGDFNNDGKPDLATSGDTSVSVLTGNGDGTFGTATKRDVFEFPRSVKVGDFNKDGKPDLVTANNYGTTIYRGSLSVLLNVTAARNDFNGDGKSDILWRNDYGSVAVWQMNGATITSGSLTSVPNLDPSWKAAGNSDFNGDGKADILWRNDNGSIAVWTMNGTTVTSSALTSTPSLDNSWKTAGTGDYNGDGKSDILWRNDNGSIAVWTMNGATVTSSALTSTPSLDDSWKVAGNSDFNGDGKADILWRNNDGSVALWQMNGAAITASTAVSKVGTDWKIAGTGDFNGDSKADILWRNDNGSIALWQMNGAAITSSNLTTTPSRDGSQTIAGIGDYNGDGKADILWRKDTGAVEVWQMNGATVVSSTLTSVTPDGSFWKIAAPII